jgi:hypothetical protein
MDLRTTERLEAIIDGAAAILFATAAAYAAMRAGGTPSPALAAAAFAFLGAFMALRAVRPADLSFAIARFDVQPSPPALLDELVLRDSDRLVPHLADELVLDDVLADPKPDSRVVRLFDPEAMPADSQGFDRRFGGAIAAGTPPDASQALLEALTKLRRSLR